MSVALEHQLDRTDQEIVFRVVSSFYDVLLAAKQLEVAEQSVETTQSIVERSQARFDSGVTVESDLLTAKVRMATRRQEVVRAKSTLETARAELNTAMGTPVESPLLSNEELGDHTLTISSLQEIERQALTNRPDLKRIAAEEAAQHQSVAVARS